MTLADWFWPQEVVKLTPPKLTESSRAMHAKWAKEEAYIGRINKALEEAGLDPDLLWELPTPYVVAAIVLRVK